MINNGELDEVAVDYVNIYKDRLPRLSLFKKITKHTDHVDCDDKYQTIGRAMKWPESDPFQ